MASEIKVTNIKANDGTASLTIANSTGAITEVKTGTIKAADGTAGMTIANSTGAITASNNLTVSGAIAASNNLRAFAPFNNVSGNYENYDIVVNETTPLEAGKGFNQESARSGKYCEDLDGDDLKTCYDERAKSNKNTKEFSISL